MDWNFSDGFEEYGDFYHGVRIPEVPNVRGNHFEFLCKLAKEGLEQLIQIGRVLIEERQLYIERLDIELKTFNELDFTDYILIVWDFVRSSKAKGIPIGKGRGSCAGSLACLTLGITDVDPIKHSLLFERFVSQDRTEVKIINEIKYFNGTFLPDLDLDFCKFRREEAISYLYEAYRGKTARILTLGTLSGKALIKECGKIVGEKTEDEMRHVSAMIPKIFGKVMEIDEAYKESEEFKKWCDKNPKAYKIALKLRNLIKSTGVHASGILISHDDIDRTIPLSRSKDGELISGYEMGQCSEVSLKLDVLGLEALTTIDWVAKRLNLSPRDLDVEHEDVFKFLSNPESKYSGIFQAEADSMGGQVLSKILPTCLEDISLSVATGRPGAFKFTEDISENKKAGTFYSFHENLTPYLKESYGVIVYQEQIMALCRVMAGFHPKETNVVRAAIGKKKKDKLEEYRPKFIEGSVKNGYSEELASKIWQVFEDSGDYLFNKCLSPSTLVETERGDKLLFEVNPGDKVKAYDVDTNKDVFVEVQAVHPGENILYEVELDDGNRIECSLEHKFLCEDLIMRPLFEIINKNLGILGN